MKATAIEHKETGLFQPALLRDDGEIDTGPATVMFSGKRFDTREAAVTFAEPHVADMINMKGRLFRLKPRRVILPLTAIAVGLLVGSIFGMFVMATIAAGLWFILKNDESQLGLWIDGLFGASNKGAD